VLTLLRDAELYAPAPAGRCDLLLAGGRVAAIGRSLPVPPVGWPVEEVALDGAPVCPGLVDVHAHLDGGGGEGGAHTRVPALQLTQLTRAGVTTAVGLLGTDSTTRSIRSLLATARGLARYGITALCYTGAYRVPPDTLLGSVREDIALVDRIVAVGELAISDHRSSQPTLEELLRVGADAHVAGLMTGKAGLVHLHLGDGERGLDLVRGALDRSELPPRTWHPTHVNRNRRLWAEAQEIVARGVTVDLTAFPDEEGAPTTAEDLAAWVKAGLPLDRLTMSSDGGGCLPTFGADGQLCHMDVGSPDTLLHAVRGAVALGVDLDRALRPVTETPARLFRLHGKGRIAAGADADLLVLNADLTVRHVLAAGRFLVRDGAPVVRGLFEPAPA
jgi:beta-aspartyl-dipeptidase (metallo-type)